MSMPTGSASPSLFLKVIGGKFAVVQTVMTPSETKLGLAAKALVEVMANSAVATADIRFMAVPFIGRFE